MPQNSLIDRTDAGALIPEDVSKEIVKGVTYKSVVMQKFRHRQLTRKQQRIPCLSLLPSAYWVNGDTGLKQTSEVNWANKYLYVEEMAVIVPVPESVLDDVDYDLWAEIKPLIEEAIAVTLDDAVLFGTNKPSSWPDGIVTTAIAAGNTVTAGTSAIDIADDINNVMGTVEADGYEVNGFVGRPQIKATLRGLRDANKNPIFQADDSNGIDSLTFTGTLFGEPLDINKGGLAGFATGSGKAHLIAGDWSQGLLGIRQDITYKVLDQAVLQDTNGSILYNLAQQDMVAMRCTYRVAFQVPNPINRVQQTEASRWPFGVLRQA